ncbi:hypothetical protein ACFQ08_03745 [Streptosporangium algeriense]|uniref:SWIM-type domain-containing protein n=1 Tax=Streptosporangium algeriense TaxID=1682748 RepID=A0ABW3DLQ3_9ACTN
MDDIAKLIGFEAKLASQEALARGGDLERAGAVQLVRFCPTLITAEVDDAAACVRFQLVDGDLRWHCTCDPGRKGAFCPHCVATANSVSDAVRRTKAPLPRNPSRPMTV